MLRPGRKDYYYQILRVCSNGHITNYTLIPFNDADSKFCTECGEPTIARCQNCKAPIQGGSNNPYVVVIAELIAPQFCQYCGKPFPWTQSQLHAAKQLIQLEGRLSQKEKETLKVTLDDIISENPRTKLSAIKFKYIITKTGITKPLRDIVVDIASDTAKKILLGE